MNLPEFFRVRQRFNSARLDDPVAEVARQLATLELGARLRPGQSVAITAGSRGISGIDRILAAAVAYLKSLQARPFVVPAMGSHGGGTAQGQIEVLASLGITPDRVRCPILASMDTVVVAHTREGIPVHFDRNAWQADHVLVVNRIKPHTRFAGPIESGLMKMLLIGLGKRLGAEIYHAAIHDFPFEQIIASAAGEIFRTGRVLAGLAIVENAHDETALIEAIGPDQFEEREKALLALARQGMPRLPFDRADVLIVDRIGKNLSGTGMDTNVIGRKFDDHKAVGDEKPQVRSIAIRGLSPETHGNATGLGIAEFCRSSVLAETDWAATRLNAITAGHASAAMAPLDYSTDREMIEMALRAAGVAEPASARLLWISDTLHLGQIECSAAYLDEMPTRVDLESIGPLNPLPFDAAGNLPAAGVGWR